MTDEEKQILILWGQYYGPWIGFYGMSTIVGYLMPTPVYHIYPTPLLGQDMTQGQFLSGVLTGLNSVFLLLD